MKTFARNPKKHPVQNRGFANYLAEKTDQHLPVPVHHPPAQAKWQQIANNSPRVAQMKAYQQMSNKAPVIQRYEDHDNGYLVSNGQNAVLKEDGSKELYLTERALQEATISLTGKGINNVRFEPGDPLDYGNRQYRKAIPIFSNPATKNESQPVRKQKLKDTPQDEIMAKLYAEFKKQQENIKFVAELLPEIYNSVELDGDRDEILSKIKTKQFMDVVGRDLGQRLLLYCHNEDGPDYTKESVLAAIHKKAAGLQMEIEAYKNQAPYLPTSCGFLKNFLVSGSTGKQVGKTGNLPEIGNYFGIDDFNDPKGDEAPWDNHYATIIYKDGDDTVTLEDAAGQGLFVEKTHWSFKMYGTEQEKTFDSKTRKEYNRRKAQQELLIKHDYTENQRLGSF